VFFFLFILLFYYFCSLFFLLQSTMSSSAPIQTSVPADNNIYNVEDADNIYNVEEADSYALEGVGVIALADDGLHDAIDDMPPLPDSTSELPRRVIATKRSHSNVSGSAKSWVWNYFKKVDAAGKHCLCLICKTDVNYSYTKSTGALGHHIKNFISLSGSSTFVTKLRFLSLLAAPAYCPLTLFLSIAPSLKNGSSNG
jgi:hypothetical protein